MALLPVKDGAWYIDPETGYVYGRPLGYLSRGYVVLDGTWSGKGRTLQAHRLVWEAVHGPIPDGMQINHLNGVKSDNRIENLELVTPKENTRHAFATGLRKALKGERHGGSKLTDADVIAIRAVYDRYSRNNNARTLAAVYGVTRKCVADAATGKTWRHLGGAV